MGARTPKSKQAWSNQGECASQVATGLAKLALVFRHEAWQATGEHGLTPTQAQILSVIAGSSKPAGLSAVAEQLAITAGTASAAVTTLVEKGLLQKRRSSGDGRAIALKLTAKGKRIAVTAAEWPETIVTAATALPDREQAGLVRGLVALIRELQEQGAVPTSRMCVGCKYFRPNEYPGRRKAHHCQYIDGPIGDSDLRVDCAEMEPIAAELAPRLWSVFIDGQPLDKNGPNASACSGSRS
ncbi:MAG: MarR family winged helix-turn-helix transcriptional regulator [Phycisphaerae bacterium]|jgi:DNA-binding MarR family transcriptional regulator